MLPGGRPTEEAGPSSSKLHFLPRAPFSSPETEQPRSQSRDTGPRKCPEQNMGTIKNPRAGGSSVGALGTPKAMLGAVRGLPGGLLPHREVRAELDMGRWDHGCCWTLLRCWEWVQGGVQPHNGISPERAAGAETGNNAQFTVFYNFHKLSF